MNLCTACKTFARRLSHYARSGQNTGGIINADSHLTVSHLLPSADTCYLCQLILSCYIVKPSNAYPVNCSTLREILLSCKDQLPEEGPILYGFSGSGYYFEVPLPSGDATVLRFVLWAPRGHEVIAFGNIKRKLPRYGYGPGIKQINSWVHKCLHTHPECQRQVTLDNLEETFVPRLPKRILTIEAASSSYRVKLLETRGLHGHYAALSHCWGPPDKRPLQTTTHNLKENCIGIEYEELPKTFRDAVAVTWTVGLKYLWIDSLCLLQDDKEEWEQEANKMGLIYRNAELTVAASGAKDSSESCFAPIMALLYAKIPYYRDVADETSSSRICIQQKFNCLPDYGPLKERGWAYQEWRLSRRVLHFMKSGMSWKCNKLEVDEWGETIDRVQYTAWHTIVDLYSGSQLTFETDRLIALQGLANEMQKTRSDKYHYGIWTGELPETLLWAVDRGSQVEHLPGIPSWSWASRPGHKSFIVSPFAKDAYCIRNLQRLVLPEIEGNGVITVRTSFLVQYEIVKDEVISGAQAHRVGFMKTGHQSPIEGPFRYMKYTQQLNRNPIGLAVLDGEPFSELYGMFACFVPLLELRNDPDYMSMDIVEHLEMLQLPKKGNEMYFVLLLKPVCPRDHIFLRVGVGFTLYGPQDGSREYSHISIQ